jgi:membrane protease YdiL (CAAX protease family)
VELLELIRGKPIPPQLILEWLGTDARKWPLSVLVGVVLVGPITEEILFRGLIYGALNRRFSTAWTIISTAALFSLGHFDINYFVPIFAIGLALGWARNKSESVWVPSLMHCSYNAANFIAMLLFQIGDRR